MTDLEFLIAMGLLLIFGVFRELWLRFVKGDVPEKGVMQDIEDQQ
jgi:hypothetical protein